MTQNDSTRVRFGPFEADLHTHELWKFGTKLKLVGQPFEILSVLVSRPGELVSREELRSRLWPAETFVDFNHGLNAAVNKLREALSDSADNPKYIETLPRRGYRFIANLEPIGSAEPSSVPSPQTVVADSVITPESVPDSPPSPELLPAPLTGFPLRRVLNGIAVLLLVVLAFVGFHLIASKTRSQEVRVLYTPSGTTRGWQKVVLSGKARYEGPQFSPDGRKIVFMSNRTGGMDLWSCDVDGSNVAQITTLGDAGTPRWSPDGKTIAFDSRVHNYGGQPDGSRGDEGFGAILLVDVASGAQRFLVVGNSNNVVPSWSRDGQSIYFASDRTGDNEVWKVPVGGGAPVRITRSGGFAAWESLDGRYIYYAKNNQANPEIWRALSSGGEEMLVSPAVRPGTWASWDLDGDGIYFVGSTLNNVPTLTYYEFSTQRLREFTTLDTFPFWFATASDGKRAVFSREMADTSSIVTLEDFR